MQGDVKEGLARERAGLDHHIGRTLSRGLALVPFGLAAAIVLAMITGIDRFEGVGDHTVTGLLVLALLVIGRWLWHRDTSASGSPDG